MKILITGATGLVGQAIIAECHSKKIDVNYLTTAKSKIVSEQNLQGFYWNPSKKEIDVECFQKVSAIINLAGSSIAKRWTKENKKSILESRLDSLKTLEKGLQEYGSESVVSFVSASGIGVYPSSLSRLYTEDESDIDASFVGEVVEKWESAINSFNHLNIKVVTIRIGIVLSTQGGALPQMTKPIKFFAGAAFGSGKQWLSWIHINDLARLFLYTIEEKLEGVYNGVAPNPTTNQEMTQQIARVLKRPLFLPNVPKFLMRLVLGKMSYLLFSSQKVSSSKIENKGFVFEFKTLQSALSNLFAR